MLLKSIAVVGTGNVGRALALALSEAGCRVVVHSREPEREELAAWSGEVGIPLGSLTTIRSDTDAVVLATAWDGAEPALRAMGPALAGKVLMDVTNPLRFTDRLELAVGFDDSGGEQVQRWAPEARVVKAFNTVGFELMGQPDLAGGPPTMFIAGDDDEARAAVGELAGELGWEVHDCGGLRAARLTEPMALLWIEHAMRTGSRGHAYRMLGVGGEPAGPTG